MCRSPSSSEFSAQLRQCCNKHKSQTVEAHFPFFARQIQQFMQRPATHPGQMSVNTACLILEPLHALWTKLGFKELGSKLGSQQGDVLNDGQPHPPMLVLSQLFNCRQQTLSKQVNAYNLHKCAHTTRVVNAPLSATHQYHVRQCCQLQISVSQLYAITTPKHQAHAKLQIKDSVQRLQ